MESNPLPVFVHLRKTAGSTLREVIRRQFRRGEVIEIYGKTIAVANQKWEAIPPEQRARLKCVLGHLSYGPHLFAPQPIAPFTLLRDPVERVVSEYYYNLRTPGEKFHAVLNRRRITLEQFVESDLASEVHNTQTRRLAGEPADAGPRELLGLASAHVRDRFAMIGIHERFEESLLLCGAVFGWQRLVCRPVNVNRWRPRTGNISRQTVLAIEQANFLDRELYRLGSVRFEEDLRKYDIRQNDVNVLRRTSGVYATARRIFGFPREAWIETKMAIQRHRVLNRLDET